MRAGALVLMAALACAAPADAEIVSRTENAFTLRFAVGLEGSTEDVVTAVAGIPQWWDPAHTYTGDAANLTFSLEDGGCWCERMTDGSIFQHGVVTAVEPARVALNAPLGPLNDKATRADLTFSAGPENLGVLAAMDFVVEGPGVGAFADAVHAVMQQGWTRYVRFIEYGEPAADD